MKKGGWIFCLVWVLVSCSPPPPEQSCVSADDCVPASCCHPSAAVNKAFAPPCLDVLCTADCVPETVDCQQGEIQCVQDRCVAVLYG